MPTITFKITSPFFNGNGSDYGAPSAIDVTVSGSTDPNIPNGQYDAWCLDPLAPIFIGDTYSADTYGSLDPAAYSPINLGALTSAQIDQLNWLIAQNFTADPKFGGAYNFGEVQAAIWEIVGYTNYNSIPGVPAYLSNNGTQVVDPNDIATLKSLAVTAIASGQALLPADTFFSAIIDPSGNVQPIIMQLHEGKLGDYVWEDLDGDGTQDANEAGVNGVVVRLLDGGGNLIAETVTGDDFSTVGVEHGFYQFTGLQAGNYQVQFIKPADFFAFTQANANANSVDAIDSDADTFGLSQVVTLGIDEINGTLDAGLVKKAEIGNRVWLDSDGDGNQDAGEANMAGVTVYLKNAGGTVVGTTTTDANGNYLFSNLTPGTYSVQFVAPAGYVFTQKDAASSTDANDSDADLVTGNTIQTVLESGESDLTWDAGLVVNKARIGDFVWLDKDADGVQDADETGIAGVTVGLKNSAGTVIATTTTDSTGKYFFDVAPGSYSVVFTPPTGYVVSPKDQGGDDAKDNDIDSTTFTTAIVTVAAGQQNLTLDAGLYQKASLGDKVWLDCDADGIQDANEPGVAGVTVQLKSAAGTVVSTTTTDASGNYLFSNLTPGTYSVTFVKPANYSFTTKDASGSTDVSDSDADIVTGNTIQTVLISGENDLSWDAGLTTPEVCVTFDFSGSSATCGTVGNMLTFTNSGISVHASAFARDKTTGGWSTAYLGAYGGGLGVTDNSEGTGGNNTHTVDNTGGKDNYVLFEFSQAMELDAAYLGYVVGDSDLQVWIGNVNGAFNNHITLSDSVLSGMGFTEVNATTLTTARLAELNAGNYMGNVIIIAADTTDTSPEDFFKIQQLDVCTTPTCECDLEASIGDRVWYDTNANGIQDAGEEGVAGVVVELRTNQSGGAGGTVLATTTTDANGFYRFEHLTPGDYHIDIQESTLPAGYEFTAPNASADDNVDSDVYETVSIPRNWGVMANTTLSGGENDMTWDAGIFKRASLGDKVWLDCDMDGLQDANEPGVAGVTVQLKNAAGTVVSTTATDANGNYLFSNLIPGTYSVTFVKPTGYSFTTKDAAGSTDANDSDADTVTGSTIQTTLVSGENDLSWDAGLTAGEQCLTFDFSGNTAVCGTNGNIRTYTDSGVAVNVSAFARDRSTGSWSTAYLGAYGGGLGVTDSSESGSGNTHTVDNTGGRNNYVLFEFNQAMELDGAYLGYVAGDSDVQVWIGNVAGAFNNHMTLSDAVLAGMGFSEVNTTTLTSARYADLNAGMYKGNVIIIAADTTDTSPEDYFKIEQLDVCTSPCVVPKASIGDRVWEDKDADGVQESGENGIAGVTVKLLNAAGTVIATTTTNASGNYLFSNLNAGDYKVQVVKPTGYYYSGKDLGGNDATDSDVDATGTTVLTTLSSGENDLSWDAGLYRKACIGDRVWEDQDHDWIQDASEPGIANVKVSLQNGSGVTIATTYTNTSGYYGFSNLDPGVYRLVFDKTNTVYKGISMTNWFWGQKDIGTNDAIDGDAYSTTHVAYTAYTTLESGENDLTWDAAITPIVIDLNGDGIHTVSRANAGGSFDIFGTGAKIQSGWLSSEDGFLAVDKNGNGQIDGIDELFGGVTKGVGFAQLASFDSNGDGTVDADDARFNDLQIWRDANGNHSTDAGELMSLAQAGLAALKTGYVELPFLDANDNLHLERSSATMLDGQVVDMTDVYFNVSAADAAAAGLNLPTLAEMLGDDTSMDVILGASGDAAAAGAAAPAADLGTDSTLDAVRTVLTQLDQHEHALAA